MASGSGRPGSGDGPDDGVRPVHAVMFDLDGTLVQTRHASWRVFERVNARFGLGVDTPEQYYELFRTNVFATLDQICGEPQLAREVRSSFLAALRESYHPVMIPGMVQVVRRLAAVSTLALVSSNVLPVMRRVLVENDLAFCFAHVFGADVVPDKRTAIRQFLDDTGSGFGRRCSADYDEQMVPVEVAADGTVLVTDTAGDVEEAVAEGIRAVGVSWGMHDQDRLLAAGAEFVALWPQEVGAYLLQGVTASPRGPCLVGNACSSSCPRPEPSPAELVANDGCACGGTCGCPDCPALAGTGPQVDLKALAAARRTRRRLPPAVPDAGGPAGNPVGTRTTADVELLDAIRRICS
jgi:phosphoglycolate phosphatase